MDIQGLTYWEEFKGLALSLRALQRETEDGPGITPPMFRGHASDKWKLLTTLERAGCVDMPMAQYGQIMHRVAPEICSITNRNFKVPSTADWVAWIQQIEQYSLPPVSGQLLGYDFMVYLRQHGFPSPLLDWTDSEFVAAYFAFADVDENAVDEDGNPKRVAIYAYIERAQSFKAGSITAPWIENTGPFVYTHPRHFTQQARYTFCRRRDDKWRYTVHDHVFLADPSSVTGKQDVLIQYTLPVTEKKKVLTELMRYNLTAYTLFTTEESLMKTMAFKVLDLMK